MKNIIGVNTGDNYICDMKVELSMQKMDEDCPELIKGVVFMDEEYAYYDRAAYICSDTFYATYRFPKERFSDVLSFITKTSPISIESYLERMDNAEIIEMEHS